MPWLLLRVSLLHAQQDSRSKAEDRRNTPQKDSKISLDTVPIQIINSLSNEANNEVRNNFRQEIQTIKADTLPNSANAKNNTQDRASKILEQKTSNLQYDSDRPEDAPWKKEQFSKDDLNNLGLPAVPAKDNLPSLEDKATEYKDKLTGLKPSVPGESTLRDKISNTGANSNVEKARHKADSLSAMTDKIANADPQHELTSAKKVYSEKYIRKIYDSLGVQKADSIFQVASRLAKTPTPKEELLGRINTPLKEQAGKEGIGFDEKNQSLKMDDAEKLQGLSGQYGKQTLLPCNCRETYYRSWHP